MDDNFFLQQALEEGKKAIASQDVPIGAIVVKDGRIIGRGYNMRQKNNDPTAHAEIIAMRQAGEALGSWQLRDCDLYVTAEPCPMCAGAMINARIRRVIYGTDEPKFGAAGSQLNLLQFPGFPHNVRITGPLAQEEASKILQDFFAELRKQRKR